MEIKSYVSLILREWEFYSSFISPEIKLNDEKKI